MAKMSAVTKMTGKKPGSEKEAVSTFNDLIANNNFPDGHAAHYVGRGHLDQVVCECGWESPKYFDGHPYAWNDWAAHIDEMLS